MSNAISSQGTRFEIENEPAGSAKTIIAISKADPGIVSIEDHGLRIGDVLKLSAIVAMPEMSNRLVIVGKQGFTDDAFSMVDALTGKPIDTSDFDAAGTSGTATPVTFIETIEHKSYQFQPAARAELDRTTLVSTAKEFAGGLKDFGSFTLTLNFVRAEAAQVRLRAALNLQNIWFRMTDPLGVPVLFQGLVKSVSEAGQVDGVPQSNVEIRVSGEQIMVM